ncbi:PhzF family phenazine biosynthesis protein [uncultured Rhodoferax sp.]|uniref:PhzF family phenazine biosynthesis protein n=1 Tax=uncultured Rhodoferax sp. TaxID=223188 RepID=UPI0025E06FC4|nr:PhzF family phenazine biosynthesis protein [uncultured Rhodoferax sp.]
MPQQRPFAQIDVFTAQPYLGNPLAVVLDAAGLDTAAMQAFARWTNLSETTFVLPPTPEAAARGADYQVRIFTPEVELGFAGHPTLGSCHAWLEAGGQPKNRQRIVQECQGSLVQICRDSGRLAFAAPPSQRKNPSPGLLAQVAAALGLKAAQIVAAQTLGNGSDWLTILLDERQTVLQLQPDYLALKHLGAKVGVAAMPGAGGEMEVRAFAPMEGIQEDPVSGSLNGSLAQWLIADEYMPRKYVVAQGTCVQREGRIHIEQDSSGQVWVGGDTVTCIRGSVTL